MPVNKKIIISVGRNHPKKGFIDLIDSLKILNQKSNKFAVLIVEESKKPFKIMQKNWARKKFFQSIRSSLKEIYPFHLMT